MAEVGEARSPAFGQYLLAAVILIRFVEMMAEVHGRGGSAQPSTLAMDYSLSGGLPARMVSRWPACLAEYNMKRPFSETCLFRGGI